MRSAIITVAMIAAARFVAIVLMRWLERPSDARNWSPDQKVLARARFEGERVVIENVRHNAYRSTEDFDVRHETRTYDLGKLDSLWFIVERLGDAAGIAHTFLSFGFGKDYVAVSIEIRRERGESFSPLLGLLRRYELMYVIADERDVIGLRTNFRRNPVFLYPVRASPEAMRRVFVEMLSRANHLTEKPEFYNTLTNNCTTNIVDHVNAITPKIPFSYKLVLPAFSDELAHELKLIPSEAPFEAVRAAHRIDPLAQRTGITEQFPAAIRALIRTGVTR